MGRRVYLPDDEVHQLRPGEYTRGATHWWGRTPRCAAFPDGAIANLANHEVTQHADGRITVKPSILVSDGNGHSWHGFIDRGIWKEC